MLRVASKTGLPPRPQSDSVAAVCPERSSPADSAPPALVPQQLLAEVIQASSRQTMEPLGMIDAALRQAGVEREEIECLAVGQGPGSYTGIRAAIALAQGWQLARGVRLLGVSSAEAIAAEAAAAGLTGPVHVVVDAQRGEFYLATWEVAGGSHREIRPLALASGDAVRERAASGGTIIGPDVAKWFREGQAVFPRAARVGGLAAARTDHIPGEQLEPIYLREVSFVKAPPARVLPV